MNPEIEKHDIVGNGILIHKKYRMIRWLISAITGVLIYNKKTSVLYKKIQTKHMDVIYTVETLGSCFGVGRKVYFQFGWIQNLKTYKKLFMLKKII